MYDYTKYSFVEDLLNLIKNKDSNMIERKTGDVGYFVGQINRIPEINFTDIIKEHFTNNEEECRKFCNKCFDCLDIVKRCINKLAEFAKNFDKYCKDKIKNEIEEFKKEADKISKTKDIRRLNELRFHMLCKEVDNYEKSCSYKFKCDIYNSIYKNLEVQKIQKLYEQFTDIEKNFVLAFLLTQSESKIFFEKYTNYMNSLKDVIFEENDDLTEKINEMKNKVKKLKNNAITKKVSKLITIAPNVFMKFLLKQGQDGYLNIRQDCCLEFDLKYDEDNDKTTLTLFFDTCNNGISDNNIHKYYYARAHICSNMKRHKILEYSYEGEKSIDFIIKSEVIQPIIDDLTTSGLLCVVEQKSSDLFKQHLMPYCEKYFLLKNLNERQDQNECDSIDIINHPLNDADLDKGIFQKGFALFDSKFIYFEKFAGDRDDFEKIRVTNKAMSFKNPITEYINKINSNKLSQVDGLILFDKLKKSESIYTDEFKNFLRYRINSTELKEADKLLLIRQLTPTKITKIDEKDLINAVKSITNLTEIDKFDLQRKIESKTYISDIIYEIQHSDKLTKADKENLINKINNFSAELTEENKKDLINKINSTKLKLDKSDINDKIYKSYLIKIINSPKLNEEDKKNLIEKLQMPGAQLNEKEKSFLIGEISVDILEKINNVSEETIDFDAININDKISDQIKKIIDLHKLYVKKKLEKTNGTSEEIIELNALDTIRENVKTCVCELEKIANSCSEEIKKIYRLEPFKNLDEIDKSLLIDKLKQFKLTKRNKSNLVNKIISDKLNELSSEESSKSSKLSNVDKKILKGEVIPLAEAVKKANLINKIKSMTEIDEFIKFILIKEIDPAKVTRGDELKSIKEIAGLARLNKERKTYFINMIDSDKLCEKQKEQLIAIILNSRELNIADKEYLKDIINDNDQIVLSREQQKQLMSKMNLNQLSGPCKSVFNKILRSNDMLRNILSIENLIKKLEYSVLMYDDRLNRGMIGSDIWEIRKRKEMKDNSPIFDFGNFLDVAIIEENENVEENILIELNKICLTEMVKNAMINTKIEGRSIITAKNNEKGTLYCAVDGMEIQDAQQLKAKDRQIKGALNELNQNRQLGLKL